MPQPSVSVIVPVYNCRTSLRSCVDSVLRQTLRDFELFLVDDGSTDGSAELLDRITDPRVRILHQANSGGPGSPRNAGLKQATGEYVFFLDADDWLGREALQRMVDAAVENGTDIVIGRYVGVGRSVPRRLFRRTVPETTVHAPAPDLYASLAPLKLFRRELIKDLRFAEGLLSHEDQAFTATAYFRARGVTVLADYDYYFWVEREDGTSVLQQGGAPDHDFFPAIDRVMRIVEANTEPGQIQDRMLRRNFREDVLPRFGAIYLAADEHTRRLTEEGALGLIRDHLTPGVKASFAAPFHRQVVHCLEHGLRAELQEIVEYNESGKTPALVLRSGRVYADSPGFGTLPDACYDVTDRMPFHPRLTALEWSGTTLILSGAAILDGAGTGPLTMVLRDRREPEVEHRLAIGSAPHFRVELDLAKFCSGRPLPRGVWDFWIETDMAGFPLAGRLGGGGIDPPTGRFAPVSGEGQPVASPYFTAGYGNLSIETGYKLPVPVNVDHAEMQKGRLHVRGRLPVGGPMTSLRITARLGGDGETRAALARVDGDSFEAELDVRTWRMGRWYFGYEIASCGSVAYGPLNPEGPMIHGAAGIGREGRVYRTDNGNLGVKLAPWRALRRLGKLLPLRSKAL